MPLIYLKHPLHGNKIATMDAEANTDIANGWTVYNPDNAPAAIEETPAVVEEAPAAVEEAPAVVEEAPVNELNTKRRRKA